MRYNFPRGADDPSTPLLMTHSVVRSRWETEDAVDKNKKDKQEMKNIWHRGVCSNHGYVSKMHREDLQIGHMSDLARNVASGSLYTDILKFKQHNFFMFILRA